jgi:hypothetical protein
MAADRLPAGYPQRCPKTGPARGLAVAVQALNPIHRATGEAPRIAPQPKTGFSAILPPISWGNWHRAQGAAGGNDAGMAELF